LAAVIGAPAGWMVSDAVERQNDFCNACHLPDGGGPLHLSIREGFDARPPASLAGRHASAIRADASPSDPARCVDCHAGVGLVGRARVKVLAARDALVWLGGDFEEPDHMSTPLLDADCLQCHPVFDETPSDLPRPRFHELGVHNRELGVDCVECHLSHEPGDPGFHFLDLAHVRRQCAGCHSEFEN
jgi:hypothetical protein